MSVYTTDPVIILLAGGRGFNDTARVTLVLDGILNSFPRAAFAQGGAKGADELVRKWCKRRGQPCVTIEAPWDAHGNSAGPMRNQWMLDYLRPSFVIAFPGGTGTADMVNRARQQGFNVYEA